MTSADRLTPSQGNSAEMFLRHPGNPIITAADLPRMVNAVFNPGATVFEGETLLLLRVEERTGHSHLVVGRSPNGYSNWTVEHDRGMFAQTSTFEEHWGIEDPRITQVGNEYLIVYTGYSTTWSCSHPRGTSCTSTVAASSSPPRTRTPRCSQPDSAAGGR